MLRFKGRKILFFWNVIFLLLSTTKISPQNIDFREPSDGRPPIRQPENRDTLRLSEKTEKKYLLPAAEVAGLNLSVWAYHRYLSGEGWSNISLESIKRNFKNGFEWDVDGYLMNQFWHPYHGSNYFNLARSNGLGFWESAPYAFGGSLMWEYFMENEPPSYNDIVNTPVTGIILGEISFRVAQLIIDESSTGLERITREVVSALINPMNGLNRIIRGEMWRSGASAERAEYRFVFSAGFHNLFFSGKMNNSRSYASIGADLNYGEPTNVSGHKKPFDYFTLHTEAHLAKGDNIIGIFASGGITDAKLNLFRGSSNVIGIYKEIDVHINTVYKLSATSVTGQIINQIPFSSSVKMENNIALSAILMGATNSEYASVSGKDYNIGPGAGGRIGTGLLLKDFGNFHANYKRFWIHTLSGAAGEEFVGIFNAGVDLIVSKNNSIGMDLIIYERSGKYKYFPDADNSNTALRFYFRQSI
jgi:hypothetical protein